MQPGEGGGVVSVGVALLLQHVWGMDALLWHLRIIGLWKPFFPFGFFFPPVNFTQKFMA